MMPSRLSAPLPSLFFTLLSVRAHAANPFERGTNLFTDWTQEVTTLVTAGAGLAGAIVIGMAMAGRLDVGWAGRIVGGLVALTGLSWVVDQIIA